MKTEHLDIKNTPRLSILIPTYNYGRFIEKAIHSILNQNFQDYELIVSDDHSQDDTKNIVNRIALRDNRVKLFVQPTNLGMVENWNWCLEKSRGDYVMFLFADDFLRSNDAITSLINPLLHDERLSMSASARMLVDESDVSLFMARDLTQGGRHSGEKLIQKCLYETCNLIGEPSAVMFRKANGVRGFDVTYRQLVDLEMWFHLAQSGDLFFINRPLVAFRRHEEQQTAINSRNPTTQIEIFRLIQKYLPPSSIPNKDIRNRILYASMFLSLRRNLRKNLTLLEAANIYGPLMAEGIKMMPSAIANPIYRIIKTSRTWRNSYRKRMNKIIHK